MKLSLDKSRRDPKFLKAAFRGFHTLDYYDGIDMDNGYAMTWSLQAKSEYFIGHELLRRGFIDCSNISPQWNLGFNTSNARDIYFWTVLWRSKQSNKPFGKTLRGLFLLHFYIDFQTLHTPAMCLSHIDIPSKQ